ncbi:MAG: DUF748 domain-containing protein [Bacteroidota bacterium]
MKRYQKILLGLLITVLVIGGGIQIYFSFFLDEQLKETAVERFHEATNDTYNLEIDDFDLRILGRRLSLSGISLTQKDTTDTDIRATLDEFSVSGIGLIKLLLQQELSLREIELVNPEVYVNASKSESSAKDIPWNRPSQQLSEKVLNVLDSITIPEFYITGLSLRFNRSDLPVDPLLSLSNSDITLYNITIDSTSLDDKRVIPADDIAMTLRDIQFQTPNEYYDISAGSIEFSTTNHMVSMADIALSPKLEKGDFADKVGHQIDRIDLGIEEIQWDEIDVDQLNKAEGLTAGLIDINNADLDIYRDKRAPDAPEKYKPLPQEMIRDIPFPMSIDSIRIAESNIRYTERKPKAEKAGYIEFANLSASLTNLTNVEEQWHEDNIPTLRAKTNVMNQAQLDAHFSFPMADEENRQEIKGSLGSMDMQPLNDALEPLAFVRIEEGKILGMDFEMNLSAKKAGGNLTMEYENLKISLLDEDSNEETFGDKAKSLMANTFKIDSDNTGDDLEKAKVDFERDNQKSVFNYWWKSLLSGLKSSIGL